MSDTKTEKTEKPEKKKSPTALETCQSDAKKTRRFWIGWVIGLSVVLFLIFVVAIYYWMKSSTLESQLTALAPPTANPYPLDDN